MKKSMHWLACGIIFLLVAVSASCATQSQYTTAATTDSDQGWTPPVNATGANGTATASNVNAYTQTPGTLSFCGRPVPLSNQDVRERFDQEFTIVVYNNARVYLWLQRMHRYFPWIEKLLRQLGMPDDLKYFIVQETGLLPEDWLVNTNYGRLAGLDLHITGNTQQDFRDGVKALLLNLQALHNQFGTWPLALAAYNCGKERLEQCIRAQKTHDYYQLDISPENNTYVLRIAAIKAVLSHPGRYGYHLPSGIRY